MRRDYTLLFLLFFLCQLTAQRQAETWHFGNNIVIRFVDGLPALFNASAMETFEGCVSYSNPSGELLFYTNGGGRFPEFNEQEPGTIWNRNHEVMYDMNGREGGGNSAVQSSIAFPVPGQNNQYYLFTMEEIEFDFGGSVPEQPEGRGLSYFIIDMTLNGGLGGVTVADQRVFVPTFEGLSATPMADGSGHWVVCKRANSSSFVIVPVTAAGVGEPVEQAVEGVLESAIKISPNGAYVFCSNRIYSFDNQLGVVAPTPLATIPFGSSVTTSFTPDSRYLYNILTQGGSDLLTRFDLQADDIIASGSTLANLGNSITGQMQIGPNGYLYYLETQAQTNFFGLSEIACPSTSTPRLNRLVIDLTGNSEDLFSGLPNYVDAIFAASPTVNDTVLVTNATRGRCPGGEVMLEANYFGEAYTWSTGDTTRSITVMAAGNYFLTITGDCAPTIEEFVVEDLPVVELTLLPLEGSNDCPGEIATLRINSSEPLLTIEWPDGSNEMTYQTLVVPGDTVSVRIGTFCGRQTTEYVFPPAGQLTATLTTDFNRPLCFGDEVTFFIEGDFIEAISWENSSVNATRTVIADSSVVYQATVFDRCNDSIVLTSDLDYSLCPMICAAEIPQLITPNRDGVNDGFKVFSSCALEDYVLRIFNRWGQLVFTSTEPNQVWDGTKDGVDQPMDVYLYRVSYRFPLNENLIGTDGEFMLVR